MESLHPAEVERRLNESVRANGITMSPDTPPGIESLIAALQKCGVALPEGVVDMQGFVEAATHEPQE
jgi:hypothetical protein